MGESARSKLTLKQRRFVEEYAADGNAVQAYFRAFGRDTKEGKRRSYKAAQVQATRLLENPIIQSEISAVNDAHSKRIRVDKERVLAELAALAFSDPDDIYESDDDNGGLPRPKRWRDVPPLARKAIQSVKVKRKRLANDSDETAWEIEELEYRFHSKTDALDKLCKRLGFYVESEGGTKPAIPVELVTRLLAALGTRQPQPPAAAGIVGGTVPPDPVVPEPGAAK